jgi:5S rRNA maturation endonuclease (ribonuclease M5)
MKREMIEEKLKAIVSELGEAVILVEGKRDEKALKSLGLKDIIALKGRPPYEIAEILSDRNQEIVILTDFDKKGRQMEKRLRCLLQKRGKQPNTRLRLKIMALGKNKIEDFGALHTPGNISLGEDDFHVKTCTDFNKIHGKSGHRRAGSYRKT